jgi:hypothetical protein
MNEADKPKSRNGLMQFTVIVTVQQRLKGLWKWFWLDKSLMYVWYIDAIEAEGLK